MAVCRTVDRVLHLPASKTLIFASLALVPNPSYPPPPLPAGLYSNPDRHTHHNCFYGFSPLPLSLFHVGFTTPICCTRHEILSVAGIASRPLPCRVACLRELGIARNVPRRPRRSRRGGRREKRKIPFIVGVGRALPLNPASPCRQPVSCSPVSDSDVSATYQLDITTSGI